MESPDVVQAGRADGQAMLDHDLGFILGAVLRSYVKATGLVVDQIPGGARGYQAVSAATDGAVESQRSLAQRLGVDRTVMTYLLDDLEEAGLVTRRPDPADRRNRHVLATDQGRQLAQATERRLRQVEDQVLDALSPGEQVMLRELLRRVADRWLAADPLDGDACTVVTDLAEEAARPARRARSRRR